MADDPTPGDRSTSEETLTLASLARASAVGFWDWDLTTNAVTYSSEWKRQIGYEPDELPDQFDEWRSRLHPDDAARVERRLQQYLDDPRGAYRTQYRLRHKDGTYRWIDTRGEIVRDAGGRPVRLAGCHLDVTEQKAVEERIEQSRSSLKLSLELAQLGCWELDLASRIVTVDDQIFRMLRTTAEAEGGYQMTLAAYRDRFLPPDMHDRSAAAMAEALSSTDPHYTRQVEHAWRRADGSEGFVTMRFTVVRDASGAPIKGLGVVQDITERKQTEVRLTRLVQGESLLSSISQRFIEMDLAQFDAGLQEALRGMGEFAAMSRAVLFLNSADAGRIVNVQEWAADPAESWNTDLRDIPGASFPFLRQELAAFRVVRIEKPSDLPANSSEAGLAGALGFRPCLMYPLVSRARLIGVLTFYGSRGSTRIFDADLQAVLGSFAASVANLVSRRNAQEERVLLERQLLQAQKMEAIGTLAGGIAHDFNNILSAIVGNLGLAKMDAEQGRSVDDSLIEIERASERARSLVQQILAFSRQQEHERHVVALAPVIDEATRLMRATIPATVSIDAVLSPDTPTVVADPTQVHQIVMNLCANAWHAMDERAGAIVVELKGTVVRADAAARIGIAPGRYACLAVRDNGHGMESETLQRVFDPFFTTKHVGKGTGLGMSVVHGIVRSHHGGISMESRVGKGTTVRVYIPAASGSAATAQSPSALTPGRGEHILLVDDEDAIVKVMSRILERVGYKVTAFSTPVAALEAFRRQPGTFDLVITDYEMPDANGLEFARVIHGERAETPVVLCSGRYRADTNLGPDSSANVRRLITKPCSASVLSRVVREVLDEGSAA